MTDQTGAPRKSGSFAGGSREQAERTARGMRDAEAITRAAEDAAEEVAEEKEQAAKDKIDSKLPETVGSGIYGEIPYAEFKRLYESVWDQIAEKDHLLTGRITFDFEVGSIGITIQSLTRREAQALTVYEANPVGFADTTPRSRASQLMEYATRRMIVQVVSVGEARNFGSGKDLTPDGREDWEKDESVRQAYDYLMDLDPTIFEHFIAVANDIDQAKYFALVENMKDPLASRSPTTGSEPS